MIQLQVRIGVSGILIFIQKKTGTRIAAEGPHPFNIVITFGYFPLKSKAEMTCHYVFMLQTIHQPQHPFSEVVQMRSAFLWPFQFLHHWSCLNQFSLSKNNALILDFIKSSSFVFLISSSPNILFSSRASCCFPAPPCNMCKKFSSLCLSLVKNLLFLIFQEVSCQAQHDFFFFLFLNMTPNQTGVQLYFGWVAQNHWSLFNWIFKTECT